MRGYLVIHVGGFKRISNYTFHVFSSGASVPDRLLPAEIHERGSTEWYEDGWAVGDNPRERFCKWEGASPMYRFHDYDEAVTYIQRLRQRRKRPHESYSLVYSTKGVGGITYYQPVSFLDDILAFEAEIDAEIKQNAQAQEERKRALLEEYPEIDRLKAVYRGLKAYQLSELLKALRGGDTETAKNGMSKSTFYKNVKELKNLGLLE
jgi:hypothetical protein